MRRDMKSLARGTVALVLAVVAVISTAGSASATEEHIVQPGETLSEIAKRYGTTVEVLQELNELPDVNYVWYGQRLLIDGGEEVPETAEIVDRFQLYTVQPGDTLFRLAGKHGISLTRLMSINGFTSEEWLSVGQELLVPHALAPAAQPVDPDTGLQPLNPFPLMQPRQTRLAVHTVQAGESLVDIAEVHEVNPGALARLNDLQNYSTLEPGLALRIPSENGLELLEGMSQRLDWTLYPTLTERWIEVDLSEQMAIAYEGVRPVKVFVISSGVGDSPTITGTFRIWVKIAMQDMRGGNRATGTAYHVEEVKNVQYFFEDYAFHGTYWHSNFGRPMSRGCINLTEEDAEWLFDWAYPFMYDDDDDGWMFSTDINPGTLVLIHER